MSTETCPLDVLVVSTDVPLLHEIAWVLGAVGYRVQTTSDIDQNALWRRYSSPDFVIIDGRDVAEPSANTFGHDSDKPHYRIFLYDPLKPTDFAAWNAAGSHDALRTPVSRGELLTRVRTGARYLEFERRLQRRSSCGELAGMYSRRGLMRKLRKMAASDDGGSGQHTLLATSIDWYAGIRRKSGETVSHNLINRAARAIRRAAGENAVSAYLGDGQFATLLVGHSAAAAKSIAETLAADFCSRESHHESTPRTTLTSAIVPWSADIKVDRLLNDALKTLELAGHSGSDCTVVQGDFSAELGAWQNDMSTGNPFASVVAQDIMEPFAAILDDHSAHGELSEAVRRANIPVTPYVDRDGRLVGVFAAGASGAEASSSPTDGLTVEKLDEPQTISHDANFREIYEAFLSRGCTALVVTAGEKPLGYITCDGFLAMIDPVHAASFSHTDKSADELMYLAVPSLAGEAAGEPASA